MRAKICGITCLQDAVLAVQQGAFALGFNFYLPSPRYIAPQAAKNIIEQLPPVITVGIFIHTPYQVIEQMLSQIPLDFAQVYEDIDCPLSLKKKMILSLNAQTEKDLPPPHCLAQYAHLLLDSPLEKEGLLGGTGRVSNWDLAHTLARDYSVILAGGLTPYNVEQALQKVKPYMVDVASGIETLPGKKDHELLTSFLRKVHYA